VHTYIKVVMEGTAKVEIVTSETDGPGQGGRTVKEALVTGVDSIVLPPGDYYINAHVTENDDEVPVTVVTSP
jgi:hypothetical protein